MSLLGQQRSLEALLLAIKVRIAVKQGLLLREQRRLDAESATLEDLLQKRYYEQSNRMQSHLATHAIDRLTGLSERAAQVGLFTTGDEDRSTKSLPRPIGGLMPVCFWLRVSLFAQDERSHDVLRATRILDSRKDFVHALHQHERQEAILNWAGETPEAIQQWKDEEWPHIDAHAANDPQRDAIFTAGDKPPIDDQTLKAAKARYLASLAKSRSSWTRCVIWRVCRPTPKPNANRWSVRPKPNCTCLASSMRRICLSANRNWTLTNWHQNLSVPLARCIPSVLRRRLKTLWPSTAGRSLNC